MYGVPASTDLPFGPIHFPQNRTGRTQRHRGLTRPRTAGGTRFPSTSASGQADMFGRDPWTRRAATVGPLSRFEDLDQSSLPLQHPLSSNELGMRTGYGEDLSSGFRRYGIGRAGAGHQMPFDMAAVKLYDALNRALIFNSTLERNFNEETGHISAYVDPKIIDHLWIAKLDWNGVDHRELMLNPHAEPIAGQSTFRSVMHQLLEALDGLKNSGPPSARVMEDSRDEGMVKGPEEVKSVLRKLQVSFQAIVELMEAVRGNRTRTTALYNEMVAAEKLLLEIREMWGSKKHATRAAQYANRTAASAGPKYQDDIRDWPTYRGE